MAKRSRSFENLSDKRKKFRGVGVKNNNNHVISVILGVEFENATVFFLKDSEIP